MGTRKLRFETTTLAALLLTAPAGRALAQPAARPAMTTQALPVPISVERERVRSSMRLQFQIQRYGMPFDAFAAGQLDAWEAAFRDFMTALRAGDAAKAASLRPGDALDDVRKLIAPFHQGFVNSQVPRVVARVGVGDGQLFVWEWTGPRGPQRRGFTVLARPGGAPRVEIVTSQRALETLIVDTLQQELLNPEAYAPVEGRGRYRYQFPLGGSGQAGAHPVLLYFEAQPTDVLVMSADSAPVTARASGAAAATTSVYQSAYRALQDKDVSSYITSYTPKSQDKLKTWVQGLTPAELNSFLAQTVKPRRVHLVLDADPVALVFYTVEANPRLQYEYMLKTGSGYKLTNAYFEGFLDDVLRDPALFPGELDSFRKTLSAAANPR